nr:hypothetical protein [Tanacetum cinerariifolium]
MITILENYEHNQDFHQIVDFVGASHIRYALTFNPTVYVSHIRQFWSTARIETTDEGTKILATVDGNLRTVSESSIRRNLKLNDEADISSLPDAKLFENLQLIGYNILPNQKFTFQKGQFSHQWKIVSLFDSMLVPQDEGSGIPTESHHTLTSEASQSSQHELPSPSLPPVTTATIPPPSALPPVADEPASPLRDDGQGEACPTDSGLAADQDRANIAKTSTLPSDSTPRVTSLAADEGSIQQKLDELMALCTSLQRKQSEMVSRFEAQELEINNLKARIKLLEDKDKGVAEQSGDDAPIKGRRLDVGEEAAERVSDDTEEMATILTSMDATTVLSSGVAETKDFKGMSFEQIEAKFNTVWKQIQYFIPMGSKEETKRLKRKGLRLEQESAKKLKTLKEVPEEVKSSKEVPEEKVKEMMQLVPIEELWRLVKESLSIRPAASDKEMEFWVELKRLVHHVSSKDKEIFMLVEKDYPLRKSLAIGMISYKLQVENYSKMANDLILKIYKIASSPRKQDD